MLCLIQFLCEGASRVLASLLLRTLRLAARFLPLLLSCQCPAGARMIRDKSGRYSSVQRKADGSAGSMTETASDPLGCQLILSWNSSPESKRGCLVIRWGGDPTGLTENDPPATLPLPE